MKHFFLLIIIVPIIGFSQRKREIIDSIHTKRLCVSYPGVTYLPKVSDEIKISEYVFTGKVVEIIRKETLEPGDYDETGPIDFTPTQNYWYVFQVDKMFKGKRKKRVKVFSRMYSTTSPLLILDSKYLIYAKKVSKRERKFLKQLHPFIYCGGLSTHIKYAEDDIKEIKKLLNK